MKLEIWAKKHNISSTALDELTELFINDSILYDCSGLNNENDVKNLVRLEASKKGARLWRNNVGAAYTNTGQFLRYGLANESKHMNDRFKSADLIGIKPVKITINMIGKTFGQFLSRETKNPNWKFTGNAHEEAQLRWIKLITALGGDACFTRGESTI